MAGSEGAAEQVNFMQPKEIPLERQVIEWANKNPQQAADLVKDWVEDK
jgi:hypothetical protein